MKICITFSLLLISQLITHAQCPGQWPSKSTISNDHRVNTILYPGALELDARSSSYNIDLLGSNFTLGYAKGLWVAGLDPAGNPKLSASTYPFNNNGDYGSGPYNNSGAIDEETCAFYKRTWVITQVQILNLTDQYEQGLLDLKNIPKDILEWPAKGNSHIGILAPSYEMAPFFDNNGDGSYNPLQGDHPIALIENPNFIPYQMRFSVYNDNVVHLETYGEPLNMEFHQVDFVVNCSNESESEQAIFTRLKYINKGQEDLLDFRLGIWEDSDLGCTTKNYVGCNTELNCNYTYNQDGIDDPTEPCGSNDRIPDNAGVVKSLVYLNKDMQSFIETTIRQVQGDPSSELPYINTMNGLWSDGISLTQGGNGYNPGSVDTVSFWMPDRPDVVGGWSMQQESYENGDYRTLTVLEHNNLKPGDSGVIDMADHVLYNEDNTGLEVFKVLESSLDELKAEFRAMQDGSFDCGNKLEKCNTDCVWPGDVDRDDVVMVKDIVVLGNLMAAGPEMGNRRTNVKAEWFPFTVTDWNFSLFGVDSKHADVYGNGYLDEDDLISTGENLGLSNGRSHPNNLLEENIAEVYLVTSSSESQIDASENLVFRNFELDVTLGTVGELLNEPIHGLAFEMRYDTNLVILPGFGPSSITTDLFQYSQTHSNSIISPINGWLRGDNTVHVALTNYNSTEVTVGEKLGNLDCYIKDGASTANPDGRDTLVIKFYNAFATNAKGEEIELGATYDTVFIENLIYEPGLLSKDVDLSDNKLEFLLYPNPSSDRLNIVFKDEANGQLVIHTTAGIKIMEQKLVAQKEVNLDISKIESGFYILTHRDEVGDFSSTYFVKE